MTFIDEADLLVLIMEECAYELFQEELCLYDLRCWNEKSICLLHHCNMVYHALPRCILRYVIALHPCPVHCILAMPPIMQQCNMSDDALLHCVLHYVIALHL